MKVRYILCSESSAIDVFSNRLSIFNLIEQISVQSYPTAIAGLNVVVGASKDDEDGNSVAARLKFHLNGVELANYEMEFSFDDGNAARAVGSIQGFFVSSPGRLDVSVHLNDRQLGVWSIPCVHAGQPELNLNT